MFEREMWKKIWRTYCLFSLLFVTSFSLPSKSFNYDLNLRGKSFQKLAISDIGVAIYDSQIWLTNNFSEELTKVSLSSIGLLYASGVIASFSPCSISLLPLTLSYLGRDELGERDSSTAKLAFNNACIAYAVGLATAFSVLGISAVYVDAIVGSRLSNLRPLLFLMYIIFGLSSLDLIKWKDLKIYERFQVSMRKNSPALTQPFIIGFFSALVGETCTSPILTAILSFVGSSHDPFTGFLLLFVFGFGYSTLVVSSGFFAGKIQSDGRGSSWVNNVFASLLIMYGTFSLVDYFSELQNV